MARTSFVFRTRLRLKEGRMERNLWCLSTTPRRNYEFLWYDVLGCFLRNVKLITLVISSLFFYSIGLSIMAFEKLRLVLPSLTQAKQTAVENIAEFFASKESANSTVSLNEQDRRESFINLQKDNMVGVLGCPLGMAVASVLVEVLENSNQKGQFISSDELPRLMGLAIKESLSQVSYIFQKRNHIGFMFYSFNYYRWQQKCRGWNLGDVLLVQILDTESRQFANDFEASFRSTFNTMRLVKQVIRDNEKISCDSEGKWNANPSGQMADSSLCGFATDVNGHNMDVECKTTRRKKRSNKQCQRQSDERGKMQEKLCSLDTACEDAWKIGDENGLSSLQQDLSKQQSFMKAESQVDCKFSEGTKNCNGQTSEDNYKVVGSERATSQVTIAGNGHNMYIVCKTTRRKKQSNKQCQLQSDERGKMQEKVCSPDPTCEHAWKTGDENVLPSLQQDLSKQLSFMKAESQVDCQFSQGTKNCKGQASEDNYKVVGSEGATSQVTLAGNVQQSNFDHVKSKVSAHNCGSGSGEIERSNSVIKDVEAQAAQYPKSFMGNSFSVLTEKTTATAEGSGENSVSNDRGEIHGNKETSGILEDCQKIVLHGHPQCEENSDRQLRNFSGTLPEAAMLSVFSDRTDISDRQYRQNFLNVFDKSVREQERSNQLKSLELMQKMKELELDEEQLHIKSESNMLARNKLQFNHSKALIKESASVAEKQKRAYDELSRQCADELAAGMILMLLALAYGVSRYSRSLLSEAITSCQATKESQKSSWFSNPMDTVTGRFRTIACEIMVISRMLAGAGFVSVIVYLLLRYTVTSSSQAKPATIILVLLGGLCGWAGKFSVDSLGGNGFQWLVCWELLCILHAFANCFTSYLFCFLNGPTSNSGGSSLTPSWIRKFVFHATLILVLPVMAGLTPFASVRDWTKHFCDMFKDHVLEPVSTSLACVPRHFL